LERGADYVRVDSEFGSSATHIEQGQVLDAVRRSRHCLAQVSELLRLAQAGELSSNDQIFFDDFWHPGIEALAYTFSILGIKPRMGAFCYAQSVDEFDFTYKMRHWMRPFEQGIGTVLDRIFVASTELQDLLVRGGVAPIEKIQVIGLIFDSAEVRSRMPEELPEQRPNRVVYSSRWDTEKDPEFFLWVAERVAAEMPEVEFVVCTSAPKMRSNSTYLLHRLEVAKSHIPQLTVKEGLTKEEYYNELANAKVQLNTANQDWVSFTLLEAAVAGCVPIYPYFRSFPEALWRNSSFLYPKRDLIGCADSILRVLRRDDLWTRTAVASRAWIYTKHDYASWRILEHLEVPCHANQ
jgi:glycosyltransferase involved in cell wall biosynthesis